MKKININEYVRDNNRIIKIKLFFLWEDFSNKSSIEYLKD